MIRKWLGGNWVCMYNYYDVNWERGKYGWGYRYVYGCKLFG